MLEITSSSQVTIGVAFLAGLFTFCASCLLPLVPSYIAYLSGTTVLDQSSQLKRWHSIKVACMFVLGFVGTFVALGSFLRYTVAYFNQYQSVLHIVAGILFLTFGLFVVGIFKHSLFSTEKKPHVPALFRSYSVLHAFIFGVVFGVGWSPCIGPVLAVILFWSSQAETQLFGIFLLTVFGLGLGLPFIVIAAVFEKSIPLLKKFKKVSYYFNIISGGMLIFIGILVLMSSFLPDTFFLKHFVPLLK